MPLFSSDVELATPADHAACRALLRNGSRSFLAASKLLPQGVRDSAIALYAFCREADDAIDLTDDPDAGLAWLQERLVLAYERRPLPIAADRALSDIVARFGIPQELPAALLEGFAWDAEGRRYEDIDGVIDYSVRVAGSVGAMMAVLMGARAPEAIARACDLGVAMQLSNIARDVGEDARNGRLYLPLQWLREHGVDPDAWLERPHFTPAIGAVVQRLLDTADALYDRAAIGVARLPLGCRPGIMAARYIYAEIGREVARRRFDSVASRAVVHPGRKAIGFARALAASARPAARVSIAPLQQACFLVDAVAAAPHPNVVARLSWVPEQTNSALEGRVAWLVGLCERLDHLDRVRGTRA
jgi:phytoene synthase